MFFIYIAIFGTPFLSIIFCFNLAVVIHKASHKEDFKLNVYLMTGAFTLMTTSIVLAIFNVLPNLAR